MATATKNPDKWIRKEISERINNTIVSTKTIPCVDVNYTGSSQPLNYVAMSTQTKNYTEMNKCGGVWDCSILLDVITRFIGTGNTGSRVMLNDIEERIISLMQDFNIEGGFELLQDIELEDSSGIDGHTGTETYFRQLIRFRIKLIEI